MNKKSQGLVFSYDFVAANRGTLMSLYRKRARRECKQPRRVLRVKLPDVIDWSQVIPSRIMCNRITSIIDRGGAPVHGVVRLARKHGDGFRYWDIMQWLRFNGELVLVIEDDGSKRLEPDWTMACGCRIKFQGRWVKL